MNATKIAPAFRLFHAVPIGPVDQVSLDNLTPGGAGHYEHMRYQSHRTGGHAKSLEWLGVFQGEHHPKRRRNRGWPIPTRPPAVAGDNSHAEPVARFASKIPKRALCRPPNADPPMSPAVDDGGMKMTRSPATAPAVAEYHCAQPPPRISE
jgi:hypothetical protein